MRRLVPNFILEKAKKDEYSGELEAYVINLDIVGFTKTTDALIEKGKSGVETLSEIINGLFSPIVEKIHLMDGFIASFAGDAMTIVFPRSIFSNSDDLILFSQLLLDEIAQKSKALSALSRFQLKAKSGLAMGRVHWKIFQGNLLTPFFYGEAIEIASLAQKKAKENQMAIAEFIFQTIQSHSIKAAFQKADNIFYVQTGAIEMQFKLPKKVSLKQKACMFLQEKFAEKQLFEQTVTGEFRTVVSCFINFSSVDFLKNHFTEMNDLIEQNGGFLNKIIHDDKGFTMLVLLGAPKTTEDIASRSTGFVLQMTKLGGSNIRIGYSMGIVFAGFVGNNERCEYTALGTEVNKAARLMMEANWGQALTDSLIVARLKKNYDFELVKQVMLKGFSSQISIFALQSQIATKHFEETVFIGRDTELNLIKNKIAQSCAGEFGGIIFIEGEAGIGKSYLLQKIQQDVQAELFWTFIICDEILHSSLFPLKTYMKNFFNLQDTSNEAEISEQIKTKFQEIRKQISGYEMQKLWNFSELYLLELLEIENPILQSIDKKIRFENTLYALKNFFVVLSSLKPVVIVIDDGQWIDEDTAKFLEILIRNVKELPITLLYACRSLERTDTFLEELPAKKENHIKLNHFSQNQILQYLQERLQTKDIPQQTLQLFSQKTEGNPFYVDQFLMYLQENQQISPNFAIIPSTLAIPDSISSILIARIDRLTQQLKQVVQTASILGREFAADVLSKMLTDIPVVNYLLEGEKEFIWNAVSDLKYIFKHSLLRETVYEMQLKKRVRELHLLAAETYIELYQNHLPEHYMEICFHFERAEYHEKTKHYLQEAANYSIRQNRIHDAIHFMERLQQILFEECNISTTLIWDEVCQDIKPYVEWSLQLAKYQGLGGFTKKALDLFEQTIAIIKKWGDKKALLEAIIAQNNFYTDIGENHKAMDNIKLANSILKHFEDVELEAEINNSFGQVYSHLGNYSQAIEHYDKALKGASALHDDSLESIVYTNLGSAHSQLGNYPKAIEYLKKSLQIEEKKKNVVSKVKTLNIIASIHFDRNDFSKAIELFENTYQISSDIGYKHGISVAVGNLGMLYRQQGKKDLALEHLQNKMEISKEIGDKKGLSLAYNTLGNLYLDSNQMEKAISFYQKAMTLAEEMNDMITKAIIIGNIGEIYFHQGNHDKALEQIDTAIEIEYELQFLSHLIYLLFMKINILLAQKKYKNAKKINEECFQIISKADFPHYYLKAELTREMIRFELAANRKEQKTALTNLKQLMNAYEDIHSQVLIAYEIALMMKELQEIEPEHIDKTIQILQESGLEIHENAKQMMKRLKEIQDSYFKG